MKFAPAAHGVCILVNIFCAGLYHSSVYKNLGVLLTHQPWREKYTLDFSEEEDGLPDRLVTGEENLKMLQVQHIAYKSRIASIGDFFFKKRGISLFLISWHYHALTGCLENLPWESP